MASSAQITLTRWLTALVEPSSKLADEDARPARLVASVSAVMFIIGLLSLLGWLIESMDHTAFWVTQALMIPVAAISYLLARTHHYRSGIWLLSSTTFIFVLIVSLMIDDPHLAMRLIVPVILISLFSQTMITVIVALLGIFATTAIFYDTSQPEALMFSLATLAAASTVIIVVNHIMRQMVTRLSESQRQFQMMEENIDDVLWMMDRNLQFTYISASVERMTGYTVEETVGQSIQLWLTPESLNMVREHFSDLLTDEARGILYNNTLNIELQQIHKDGSVFWTETSSRSHYGESGRLEAIFGVTRDISERKLADQQRTELAMERERVALMHDLLNNLSHDFMTPISSINTNLYLLQRRGQTEANQEHLVRIALQVDRLRTMIEAVMMIVWLDNLQPQALDRQMCDLTSLVPDIVDRHRQKAALQEIILDIRMAQKLPPIYLMPEIFKPVIDNLLENALAYTPAGGTISVCVQEAHKNMIQISVCDTGAGMTEEVLAQVFEPFYRGESHRPMVGGLGLGLPIVRRVVDLHQGSITIESQPKKGTQVRILLPAITEAAD